MRRTRLHGVIFHKAVIFIYTFFWHIIMILLITEFNQCKKIRFCRAYSTKTSQSQNDPESISVFGLMHYLKPFEQGIQPVSRAWSVIYTMRQSLTWCFFPKQGTWAAHFAMKSWITLISLNFSNFSKLSHFEQTANLQ